MARPRAHTGDSQAEQAILGAAERLLRETPFHQLTTEQILSEAGISRGTFYKYYGSKFDVLSALMWRIYDELFAVIEPWLTDRDESPEQRLREGLGAGVTGWEQHGKVVGAMLENLGTSEEIAELWDDLVDRAATAIAERIDKERASGAAPPGPDSRVLATVITRAIQDILYAGRRGLHKQLPSSEATLEPMVTLWHGAVYGKAAA